MGLQGLQTEANNYNLNSVNWPIFSLSSSSSSSCAAACTCSPVTKTCIISGGSLVAVSSGPPSRTMDAGIDTQTQNGASDKSADIELRLNNDDAILGTSVEEVSSIGKIDQVDPNSASMEVEADEPYVGQEFESEAAAHAFYNAYALRVGFRTRVNDLSRSRVDGSVIARTLVCNKEGYRVADKRDRKSVRPRPPTRVGCKAMISMKKLSNGNWVVAKFVKEHAHSLTPGKSENGLNEESSDEQMKIKELTQQLMVERKRSASYRKIIDLLFNHIDDHTQHLSQKILRVNDILKDIASSEGKGRQNLH